MDSGGSINIGSQKKKSIFVDRGNKTGKDNKADKLPKGLFAALLS
jgi:hypothetical protein